MSTLEIALDKITAQQPEDRTPVWMVGEDKWLSWLRGGCQRDKNGKPILPRERKGAVA